MARPRSGLVHQPEVGDQCVERLGAAFGVQHGRGMHGGDHSGVGQWDVVDFCRQTEDFAACLIRANDVVVDGGPHPNPHKAAEGYRLRVLTIDEVSAAAVRRIFEEYLDGKGDRAIANGLNLDGIPGSSQSAMVRL
ncbi:MAG: recombinase family protein [Labedaea sp.]